MSQPIATSAFIASIGVNVDMDFTDTPYANSAAVAADIAYLGITNVRDILPTGDADSLAPYAALAAAGIKFDLIVGVGGFGLPPTMASVKAELDAFAAKYPGAIASIEGPNEPNIYPFSYAGKTGTAAAVAYQTDLYKTVKSDPALSGVTVTNFAFGGVGPDVYAQAGNESAIADAGNIHSYPDGNGTGAPQQDILNQISLAAGSTPGELMDMTEFGYSTYSGGDVTQAIQASFELDGLFDAMSDGISSTYLYELLDGDTGTTGYEDNFGQFESNATTPKAAAVALHNLTAILADSGTTLPGGTLNYTVSGLTNAGGNTLLLQKSTGAFDLAVWAETPAIDDTVTIALGATYANVEVFDPTLGTGAVNVLHNVSSVALDVTGHPLIVQVEPNAATVTAAPVAPTVIPTPPAIPAPVSTPSPAVVPAPAAPNEPAAAPAPVLTPVPTPTKTVQIASGKAQVTIAVNNETIVSKSGSHTIFINATGDVLKATGGTETVTALQGGNSLLTGSGNDTITFGSQSTVDAGSGTNTMYDEGSGNTIVLPESGAGIDLIHGNVLTNGDVFDLRDMLQVTTWSGVSNSDLGDWIHIRTANHGADAIISVAPTGSFLEGSHDVARIVGAGSISLATLLSRSVTT